MIQMLIGLVIGILIGWNWVQPPWARTIQTRIVNTIRTPPDKTGPA